MKNIVLIIADQFRMDYVGGAGTTPVQTPNINELARRGVSWTRARTPAPLCGPARAAIFTGLYPHEAHGVLLGDKLGVRTQTEVPVGVDRDMMINDAEIHDPPVLTELLRDAGYHTAYAGKWHLGNDVLPRWFDECYGEDNQQYMDWLEENGLPAGGWPLADPEVRSHRVPHMSIPRTRVNPLDPAQFNDAWIADIGLRMLRNRAQDKPIFLVCGFNGPHPPFKIPEPYYSMYNPADFPEPVNFGPGSGEPASKQRSFYRTLWNDHGKSWDDWRESAATYAGFCTLIDDQVGRIVAALSEEGTLNDTLVIFTSDHGEMLGQHGLWHKMQPYEESVRVPLVLAGPGVGATGAIDEPASLLDIPGTVLRAAGIDDSAIRRVAPNGICDLRAPETADRRQFFFAEQTPLGAFHGEVEWRMVTDDHWKLVWNRGDRGELYNLASDPSETVNRFANETTERDRMIRALLEWMGRSDDRLWETASSELSVADSK